MVLQQPNVEVAKGVFFDVRLQILMPHDTKLPLVRGALLYEDNNPVDGNILNAQYLFRDGVCEVRVRISELSKMHDGRLFRLVC